MNWWLPTHPGVLQSTPGLLMVNRWIIHLIVIKEAPNIKLLGT